MSHVPVPLTHGLYMVGHKVRSVSWIPAVAIEHKGRHQKPLGAAGQVLREHTVCAPVVHVLKQAVAVQQQHVMAIATCHKPHQCPVALR